MSTINHVESFPEKKYVKFNRISENISLGDAPSGLLLCNGVLIAKTEYFSNGAVEAYIIASGERFWGGCKTAEDLNALPVSVLDLAETNIEGCRMF